MIKPTFYYIKPKYTDEFGLTHGYGNSFAYNKQRDEFNQYAHLKRIKHSYSWEGPPRLYEVPRISSIFPVMLISENVKAFLTHFKLPEHIFIPVELEHYHINTDANFFLLQLKKDTLLQHLDWQRTNFFYTPNSRSKSLENKQTINKSITSEQDILDTRLELKNKLDHLDLRIHPYQYPQKEHFDIVTYIFPYDLGKVIMVADYFKDAFEKCFPNQVDFFKVNNLEILVDEKAYNERKRAVEEMNISFNHLTYEMFEEDQFYYSKMARLKENNNFPNDYKGQDEFSEKEKELKKIFPEEFKKFCREGSGFKNFELIPIKRFYIESEYASTHPKTYGAVIIGEDGSGEAIGLLLKKESDFELSEKLYYFSHEDGNVFEVEDILTL